MLHFKIPLMSSRSMLSTSISALKRVRTLKSIPPKAETMISSEMKKKR